MDIIIIKHTKSACLAQPVEHAAVNRSVGGSSPSTGAIERNRIAVSFLFLIVLLEPPDAVFALHDSRVQISWRKHAIPSRLALLTGVESAGRRHRRRKANFATPRATARGVCMYACAKPHRKFFRRGPRFMPPPKMLSAGAPTLLFASQKRKSFAVLLVPAELSRRSLVFAPRGGFAAVSFLFLSFSSNPLTLLYPTENSFGGGPGLYPTKHTFCGAPDITPPKMLSAGTPVLYPTKHTFCGDPGLMPSFLVTAENVFFNST